MDDERIIKRVATSLGLRRENVRHIVREEKTDAFAALLCYFPAKKEDVARTLTDTLNDMIDIEAGLGDEAYLDLWGARRHRFARDAGLIEKLLASCLPGYIDKKYEALPRALAGYGRPAEQEALRGADLSGVAVVVVTSHHRDGSAIVKRGHDADRTERIVFLMEREEDRLRSIIRHAVPSHHLLPSAPSAPPMAQTYKPTHLPVPGFIFTPVFTEPAPSSITLKV